MVEGRSCSNFLQLVPNHLAHSYGIVTVPSETSAYRLTIQIAIFVAFPVL
jgi:hypothetical protein